MQMLHHRQEDLTSLPEPEKDDSHKRSGHRRRNVIASVVAVAAVSGTVGATLATGSSHHTAPAAERTVNPTPNPTPTTNKVPSPSYSATSIPSATESKPSVMTSATVEVSPTTEPTDPNKVSAVEPVLMVASTPDQLYDQVVHNLDCLWTSKDQDVQQACLTRLVGTPENHAEAAAPYQSILQKLNQQYLHESNPYADITTVDYTLIDKGMDANNARLVMKEVDSTGSVDEVSRLFKHVTATEAGINNSEEMVWILDSSTVLSSNGQ